MNQSIDTQAPPFFRRGPAPLVRLAFFSLLSCALLISDSHFRHLETVRNVVSVVLYPLQRLASFPGDAALSVENYFSTQAQLRRENSELKQENQLRTEILKQAQALQAENLHLRELLKLQNRPEIKVVSAEILYTARDAFTRKVVVDKGSYHGLTAGEAVIDDIGLIGQMTRVHWLTAEINLITDKEQVVPVKSVRTGLRAVLFGTGQFDSLELRFLPVNTDIREGDMLVTSGIDGSYPADLPVAIVTSIERNAAYAFAKIHCIPAAGVNRQSQVLILSSKHELLSNPLEEDSAKKKRPDKHR